MNSHTDLVRAAWVNDINSNYWASHFFFFFCNQCQNLLQVLSLLKEVFLQMVIKKNIRKKVWSYPSFLNCKLDSGVHADRTWQQSHSQLLIKSTYTEGTMSGIWTPPKNLKHCLTTLTRYRLIPQVIIKVVRGEQMKAHPLLHSACTTLSLQGICLWHPNRIQAFHTFGLIISETRFISSWSPSLARLACKLH